MEERQERVVRRRDNRMKEDEEDERGMRFLFLSSTFITSIEFILVVSPSLVLFTVFSLSTYYPLGTGVNVMFLMLLESDSFFGVMSATV